MYLRRDAALWTGVIVLAGGLLMAAARLHPSITGIGTHTQLGLPPCIFLRLTGLPCPSCGLTTSFSHAVRLQFRDAFLVQPFGLFAWGLTVLSIPASGVLLWRRVSWQRFLTWRVLEPSIYVLLVLYLAGWLYRLAVMR